MAAQERVIGVDLGGTKILAGVVGRDGEVVRRREWPTPVESQDELLAALGRSVEGLMEPGVVALGFSIPSVIDQRAGRALSSVNIPLHDLDFRARMEARFGKPVGLENDANSAAFAEWRRGAGTESATMVMLTLGTGVGGGFVLDG